MLSPKRILIVDDHAIVRRGLAQLLNEESDLEVCAESESARETFAALKTQEPDLAIVDLSLRDESGLELIENLRAQKPGLPVLVLSMHDETFYAQRAIRAGARGYIMKEEAPNKIVEGIRKVLSGQVYVSNQVAEHMLGQFVGQKKTSPESPVERLSNRELQILQLIGKGMATRDIAHQLHLSVKTIDNHREHIKSKLSLKNANELVQFAVRWMLDQG